MSIAAAYTLTATQITGF